MIIKELDASFGKLKNKKLVLKDGLNVICAPNESGKSTWCAFIRAMLYGIDTSRRKKEDYLPDKTRYLPWAGGVMEGTMRLTAGGKDITIQRTSQGQAPMRKLSAVYDLNGEPVENFSGEAVTGASEDVFSRTAFIGQAGVKVVRSDDLDRRIDRIVSSGDEEASYSEIDRRLRKWQRELKYNKTGRLPMLEERLDSARRQLESLETENGKIGDLKKELDRKEARVAALRGEMELHRKREARETRRRLNHAKQDMENAGERMSRLRESVGSVTREDVVRLRGELSALEMLRGLAESDISEKYKRIAERDAAEERLNRCAVKGVTPLYAGTQAEKAAEYDRKAAEFKNDRRRKTVSIALTALCVICIVTATVFNASTPALALSLVGAAASGIALYLIPSSDKQSEAARDAILNEFGMDSADELTEAAEEYMRCSERLKNAETGVSLAESACDMSKNRVATAENELLQDAGRVFGRIDAVPQLHREVERAADKLDELLKAKSEYESAGRIYEMLNAEQTAAEEDDGAPLPEPEWDRETTLRMLRQSGDELAVLRERYNQELGAVRSMGDPAVLKGEIEELEKSILDCRRKYDAVTLAVNTLKDADSEMQTRFSPVISEIAGEYMRRMTGGKYLALRFDKSLDATARAEGDSVSRGVLSLSQGTKDQLYLSLRLAMCSLMLPECPVILDDALTCFDDDRMKRALDLLLELSETRQVIVFSCHSREADYFSGDTHVNVITGI
ncbi:MAG: AAA family ATPase [Oscillospiraceae bacterium]|nr:AAA family ATPase [Oscillospiraceae bacterium]